MRKLIPAVTLLMFAGTANAQDSLGSPDEIRDTWGSVLYCQAIYAESQVKNRIYPGDLQSCQKADNLVRWSIGQRFNLKDQEVLEKNAQQKAKVIRYNTRDIQAAVQACREQCRAMAASYDEKQAQGQIEAVGGSFGEK